jgi:hypothetical protein
LTFKVPKWHASGGGSVAKHLPRHLKVEGSSPATAAGTGQSKWQKSN